MNLFTKCFIALICAIAPFHLFSQDLVITGVFDGPLSGGTPKAIEFFAQNDIPNLSAYGFGSANNGGGTDDEEFTFSGSASAGDYIYVSATGSSIANFTAYFGFDPDFSSGAASINGDDAIELFFNGTVIDVFGDINVDGTGQPWDYQDGWAYRVDDTGPDGTTFTIANWTFSGANAVDGCADNATCGSMFPIGTYSATPPPPPTTETCFSDQNTFSNIVISNDGNVGAGNLGEWNDAFSNYQISGFCGGGCAEDFEVYLVSPEFSYAGATVLEFNFNTFEDFDDTDVEVLWSVDYAGDPATATWNLLTTLDGPDQGGTDFNGSESLDLTGVTDLSAFHVAFRYATDGTNGYSRWRFSNIEIESDVCGCVMNSIVVSNISDCNDNGTDEDPTDDFFTFDIEINFDMPATATTNNLEIELFANGISVYSASVPASSIGATSYTATGLMGSAIGGDLTATAKFSEDESCFVFADNLGMAPTPCSVAPCSDLFFSEYVEGSSNNKCLEIHNPTMSPIDLGAGDYEIRIYFNGSTNANNTIDLTGTIAPGDVFVVCDDNAMNFYADADLYAGGSFFNGDDAVQLAKAGLTVDIVGQIGFDPGSQWGSGDVSTQNNTILKRQDIQAGDINPFDEFDPATSWNGFPINFHDLGMFCGTCTSVSVTDFSSTDETCAGDNDGSISVTATSPFGALEVSFDGGQTFGTATSISGLAADCYTVVVRDANVPMCTVVRQIVVANLNPSAVPQFKELGVVKIGSVALGGAEIIAFDADSEQVIASSGSGVQFIDFSDPFNPVLTNTVDPQTFGFDNSEVTSVAIANGIIAAAVPDANEQLFGDILFFNPSGAFLGSTQTGALPGMVTFTPDGTKLLVANEGEPSDDYNFDPDGSVTIVDVTGSLINPPTTTVGFGGFNDDIDALRQAGVRIYGPDADVDEDLEPEYITVSPDGATAYVVCQENNAMAILDIASETFVDLQPLGVKEYCEYENAIDASDADGGINIKSWSVVGLYQPEGMASFEINGTTYIATANEGDARNYGGFSEEARIGDLTLDPNAYPDAAELQADENLGRLFTSSIEGDKDFDGDIDQLVAFGGRSFSIWDANLNRVFDSGDDFERLMAAQTPAVFNANENDASTLDANSTEKGPEPETVKVAEIGGEYYAFVGVEHGAGGVIIYNVTDPANAYFVDYVPSMDADISVEDLIIIAPEDNAVGKFLMVAAFETSSTMSVFLINDEKYDASIGINGNAQGGSGAYAAHDWQVVGGTAEGVTVDENSNQATALNLSDGTCGTVDIAYAVTDANGCESEFTQTINVYGPNGKANILDPCRCLDNAGNGLNGQFGETIEINSPPNQIWTVTKNTGLYFVDAANVANPAVAGQYYPLAGILGAQFEESGAGVYRLSGVHVDGLGYEIEVTNNATGQVLTIGNTCDYPTINITGFDNFDENAVCTSTAPFNVTITGNTTGLINATLDGVPVLTGAASPASIAIDPASLSLGSHNIEVSFDADPSPNSVCQDCAPGCAVSERLEFIVGDANNPTPACNDQVVVALNDNCQAIVTGDLIVENPSSSAYSVEIRNNALQILSNPLGPDDIGETYTVKVTDICTGNSCWGTVVIEDKSRPEAVCFDYEIMCFQDIATIPFATGFDNCDADVEINLSEEVYDDANQCNDFMPGDGLAGSVTLTRTFVAVDDQGNTSLPCDQVITILRPSTTTFPDDIVWSCEQYAAQPNIIDPSALTCGPLAYNPDLDLYLDGTPIAISDDCLEVTGSGMPNMGMGTYCNYGIEHSDIILASCGYDATTDAPVFKIVRTWTVLDWCTGQVLSYNDANDNSIQDANEADNVQIIKVTDITGPTVAMMPIVVDANIAGSHPQACASTGIIPVPGVLNDNCSGIADLKIFTPAGEADYLGNNAMNGGTIPGEGLGLGNYMVTYVATDNCGNVTELEVPLEVRDMTRPSPICDEITDVSLSSDGYAVVDAIVFDDGSVDNCCIDRFEVKKMEEDLCDDDDEYPTSTNESFNESVSFCCEEVGTTVTVIMQVWDCNGNTNTCMVDVNVEDKTPPTVICPADVTIDCERYLADFETGLGFDDLSVLDALGVAQITDNCGPIIEHTVTNNLDQCQQGELLRNWEATDPSGNASQISRCTQRVTVTHVSDWAVMFPDDLFVECGENLPDFGTPTLYFESCELLATSYKDEVFTNVPDACYKIARQWTVINWCTAGDDVTQSILEPSEAELVDIDFNGNGRETTINPPAPTNAFTVGHSHRTFRENLGEALNSQGDPTFAQDGFITYEQIIKVNDIVAPVFDNGCEVADYCIFNDDCFMDLTLPIPGVEECSPEVDVVIYSTTLPNFDGVDSARDVPPGTYSVTYRATDNCGNWSSCLAEFDVVDCKKPTPYCKEGLIVGIMNTPTPMIEVWASDLDDGSFDNCGVKSILINQLDANGNFTTPSSVVTFNCDQLGEQPVQLWITDVNDNQDYCETFVIVQDQMNHCGGDDNLVQGNIATEESDDVSEVAVQVNAGVNGFTANYTTTDGGMYEFMVPSGNDYTITPIKDINPLNGVTTFDLVQISKHILGVATFDSPYKMIAADANKSGSITTFDLVQVRKLILFIDDNFTNNTSWRFVPKAYQFSNPANPFADNFPEVISLNNLTTEQLLQDFVAIKIGDVNGSANANNLLGTDDRTKNGILSFVSTDITLEAGKTYEVPVTAENFHNSGYQFTLALGDLELIEVEEGIAKAENFGFTLLSEKVLTTSWNHSKAVALATNEPVFTLVVKATTNTLLSEQLAINSTYTSAEAYTANGDFQDVALVFTNTATEEAGFELYQNTPNPFAEVTKIGFNLPLATKATITISDVSGRVLKVMEGDFAKGYNAIEVSKTELGVAGVLYYQLKTDNQSATKKMIIVE